MNDHVRMTIARFPGAALAFVVAAQTAPAMAQGTSVESLHGKSITASVQYEVQLRREGREFAAPVTAEWRLAIGADNRVTGSISRTSVSPRGPVSTSRPISAVIGRPGQIKDAGGHGLILLSGNTLTLLRTFEVGGIKTTITLTGGGGCSIDAPVMKEVGAGPTRRDAIVGGSIEILSSRQVSSTCRVK